MDTLQAVQNVSGTWYSKYCYGRWSGTGKSGNGELEIGAGRAERENMYHVFTTLNVFPLLFGQNFNMFCTYSTRVDEGRAAIFSRKKCKARTVVGRGGDEPVMLPRIWVTTIIERRVYIYMYWYVWILLYMMRWNDVSSIRRVVPIATGDLAL